MSQSLSPAWNHSSSFLTMEASTCLGTHVLSSSSKALSRKKKCSDSRSDGVVPETTDTGFFRSMGA